MIVRVEYDQRCKIDLGPLTPDRELLLIEYLRALRELFQTSDGLPRESKRVVGRPDDTFVLDDEDWRIGFTRREERTGLLQRTAVVTIFQIELKRKR